MDAHHLHGAQQRNRCAGDVLVVGVQGLADADPRVLEAGQVHHAFAAVVAQCVGDQVVSRIEPLTNAASAGTNSAWPLDRSSMTTGVMPAARKACTTCEPI